MGWGVEGTWCQVLYFWMLLPALSSSFLEFGRRGEGQVRLSHCASVLITPLPMWMEAQWDDMAQAVRAHPHIPPWGKEERAPCHSVGPAPGRVSLPGRSPTFSLLKGLPSYPSTCSLALTLPRVPHPFSQFLLSHAALLLPEELRRGHFPWHRHTLHGLGVEGEGTVSHQGLWLLVLPWTKGAGELFGSTSGTLDAKHLSWRTSEKGRLMVVRRDPVEGIRRWHTPLKRVNRGTALRHVARCHQMWWMQYQT